MTTLRRLALPVSLLVAATAALAAAPAGAAPAAGASSYVVRFAPGTAAQTAAADAKGQGMTVRRVFTTVFPGMAITATPAQAAALAKNPNVVVIEPDIAVKAVGTQSSPTWGLDRIDQAALPLDKAYTYATDGTGVTAYVVDTGVRTDHADFTGRVGTGYSAIADGNGVTDCNGHGTHVAGTVAGTTYGVAKKATVVPVRVLDCAGSGTSSGVIAGLDWATAHHAAGVPAVLNMSLGGGVSSTLDAAVNAAIADGITVIVAAGNSTADACTSSPARVPAAITVAASDSTDRQASFSNYGSCVDLYAPGVSITSDSYASTTGTAVYSGTSMASPHVAGAAALLSTATSTPSSVTSAITSAATPGVIVGATTGTPNRLLRIAAPAPAPAPAPVATAPSAATSVTATAGSRSASLTWVQGANGGSPLTSQIVKVYSGGRLASSLTVSATATSVRVGGLKAGTSYAFTVTEVNAVGASPESAKSNTVTALR